MQKATELSLSLCTRLISGVPPIREHRLGLVKQCLVVPAFQRLLVYICYQSKNSR